MRRFITGLAEYCYNGIAVIRGYAPADVLINSSTAHSAYQRPQDECHVEEILNFIQGGNFAFMPEVILSYDYKNIHDDSGQDLLTQLNNTPKLHDIEFDLQIKQLKSRYSKHIMMSFPVQIKKTPFHRLDGNHRLEALSKIPRRQASIKIPFAIILFSSRFDDLRMLKNEMMIFHNLNSKALPLNSEQQIKGLLNLFSADELENFGDELSGVKKYICRYKTDDFADIKDFLNDAFPALKSFWNHPYAILQKSLQIAKRSKSIEPDKLNRALRYIESEVFAQNQLLQSTRCIDLLPVYIYYVTSSLGSAEKNAKIAAFTDWVIKNKLYMLKSIDANSVIAIFDKLYEIRKKQIFVAMPFDTALNFVFDTIKRCVQKINTDFNSEIPEPVRIDRQIIGFSYDIVQSILDNIKGAGLLIADLTNQNANVYYEAGYAQGLIHAKLGNTTQILYLISNPKNPEEPFVEGKFDVQHYKMIPYKNTGNGTAELEANLIKELKAFYGIGE